MSCKCGHYNGRPFRITGNLVDEKGRHITITGLANVVEDTSPTLGGHLDADSKRITGVDLLSCNGVRIVADYGGALGSHVTLTNSLIGTGSNGWTVPRLPTGWTGTTTNFLKLWSGAVEYAWPVVSKA
jgi:hypothetical protein